MLYSPLNSYLYVHWILNKYDYYSFTLKKNSYLKSNNKVETEISYNTKTNGGNLENIIIITCYCH